uniref:Serine/threonine-protein kinase nek2 n=1 Tax=Cucumis melo TaxID=3656 RepID=A0A9I9ELW8_CUCME
MWKKARVDKKGQYDNEDVQEVVNRIDEISKTCADKEPFSNDVLTQALGTRESSGRVCGVGGYLHSQDELSNYTFVDPSLISIGHNIQEVRARNLCSRLNGFKTKPTRSGSIQSRVS